MVAWESSAWNPGSLRADGPADVGRGTHSSPEGKRALHLADASVPLCYGQEMPRCLLFYLQSIIIVDKHRECILQGAVLA